MSAPKWASWLSGAIALSVLGLLLTWASVDAIDLRAWASFTLALSMAVLILFAGWWIVRYDPAIFVPEWLFWLLLGAVGLRLVLGVFFYLALPAWGYGSPVEQAGYVMADAHARDTAAWELAAGSEPLWTAFRDYRLADQYGGLLFFSALIYRYLGGGEHLPLIMVVIAASFSSLSVIFTWAFVRRAWNALSANLGAWALALYPEAILLGSSQMREAFTVTLVLVAFYGLVRYWQDRAWTGFALLLGGLIFSLPFSPPFTALMLGMLVIQALALGGRQVWKQRNFWYALVGLGLIGVVGLWLFWGRIAPEGINNPFALVGWWLREAAKWQTHVARRGSGWLQKIFDSTPESIHIWFLLGYGVLQPFLPAAVLTSGNLVWKSLAIWRALGWTLLLPLLLYAPLRVFLSWGRDRSRQLRIAGGLSLIVWWGILLASWRSGGDLWDNPRYRVAFAGLQIALGAWAWASQRESRDPWLARTVIGVGFILAWFVPWYLRRVTPLEWPVQDVFKTVGLGLASAVLFFLWDWSRKKIKEQEG